MGAVGHDPASGGGGLRRAGGVVGRIRGRLLRRGVEGEVEGAPSTPAALDGEDAAELGEDLALQAPADRDRLLPVELEVEADAGTPFLGLGQGESALGAALGRGGRDGLAGVLLQVDGESGQPGEVALAAEGEGPTE